ncbi:MAG: aspartate aminotransferase family protein [Atribacterota bacterium]|nr:aspartate aminotransferase family protein [Atribacterota bacterium]
MKKFISIKTDIPGPKSRELAVIRERYVFKPMGESLSPGYIDFGEGALVTDVDGNTFIDLTGGWGCLALGHSHPAIISAIKEQVNHFIHTDFTAVPYESFVMLCQRLSQLAPGGEPKSVALFNSGAEAIENAVKVARGFTGRSGIIVFENCFHGRTLLTLTMTHKAFPYKYKFGPFAPEVYRLPYPNSYRHSIEISEFENIMKGLVNPETIAAIVIEPIQGEGGFNIPAKGFLEHIRELCNKYGILMITDEIQCGMGRTGKFFAIENWKIEPDIVCLAKSLASGLPLSAVIASKRVTDELPGGSIGGTYVGNPVCCQVAKEVIRVILQEDLLKRALEIGEVIKRRFNTIQNKYPLAGDVRGLGAMTALELVKDRQNKNPATEETVKIVQYCLKHGVLLPTAGINKNIIRILTSLVITDEQIEESMDVLEEAFSVVN